MKANRSLTLTSDEAGNMGQVAVGAIITIVIAGILGVIGLSIMDGVSNSVDIEDTTYIYTGSAVNGNETIDIQNGVINSATMVVTNNNGTTETVTFAIAGTSSDKSIADGESDTWAVSPEATATEATITTASENYDYSLTIVVDSGSQFTEAHASVISGISGAFGMSATLLLVVIAIAIVGLVARLIV